MDTFKLDELMRRARKIDTDERKNKEQRAKAVRNEYAEVRKRLKTAEAEIIALSSRAASVRHYASQFRWDLLRADGRMPVDVKNHLDQLNASMTGGLNSIREDIRKIDEFSEADLALKWRPSKEIGGSVANAGHAEQMISALERELEFWAQKLETNPLIAGDYSEAIEGERPPNEESRRAITNLQPGD